MLNSQPASLTDQLLFFGIKPRRNHQYGPLLRRLPNLLSYSRVIPAIMLLLCGYLIPDHNRDLGVWFMVIATVLFAATDSYDGALARRFGVSNGKGGEIDPIMDLVVIFAFHVGWLMSALRISTWYGVVLFILVASRLVMQLLIAAAATLDKRYTHEPIKASTPGKIKTVLDCVIIIPVGIASLLAYHTPSGIPLVVSSIALMVITLILGQMARKRHLRRARANVQ